MPRGIAMSDAKRVTTNDPTMSGHIPNEGGLYVGYHSWPKTKLTGDTVLKRGSPSMKRKIMIRPRTRIDTRALVKKSSLMMSSLALLDIAVVPCEHENGRDASKCPEPTPIVYSYQNQ